GLNITLLTFYSSYSKYAGGIILILVMAVLCQEKI
ncbi:unnamed protein product, partial [marine sediment metagenome]